MAHELPGTKLRDCWGSASSIIVEKTKTMVDCAVVVADHRACKQKKIWSKDGLLIHHLMVATPKLHGCMKIAESNIHITPQPILRVCVVQGLECPNIRQPGPMLFRTL